MFKNIFKRSGAKTETERAERGRSGAPHPVANSVPSQTEAAASPSLPVDETMIALSRELSGLAHMEVGQAAKERGWASLRRELERRPIRAAGASAPKGAGNVGAKTPVRVGAGSQPRTALAGNRRWMLGSAVAAVAVVAVLLGTYSAGLLSAGDGDEPGTPTSVVSSDGTQATTPIVGPDTTGLPATTEGPTTTEGPVTTDGPASTEATTPTTQMPGTTVPTGPATPSTTPTSPASPDTTQGPVTTNATTRTTQSATTTQPAQTTTTGQQQMAAAQLNKTAKAAALDLGALVVDYFVTGDMSGARALVASGAQSSLVQMISSLNDPYGFRWVSTKPVADDTVRVTLEFSDRVSDGQGEMREVAELFRLTVRVTEERAVITDISAGS